MCGTRPLVFWGPFEFFKILVPLVASNSYPASAQVVLEIGAGDGRLSLLLRSALPKAIVVLAADGVAHKEPVFPVALAGPAAIIADAAPDVVVAVWPRGGAAAAVIDGPEEYVLVGVPAAPPAEIAGWSRKNIAAASRWQVSRADLPDLLADPPAFAASRSATVSYRRRRAADDGDGDGDGDGDETAPPVAKEDEEDPYDSDEPIGPDILARLKRQAERLRAKDGEGVVPDSFEKRQPGEPEEKSAFTVH